MFKDKAREFYEIIRGKKNVVGVSLEPKKRIKRGVEVDEYVLRVYVEKKEDVPQDDRIPPEYKGFKTDVVEIGRVKKLAYVDRYRPVPCGVSTGRLGEMVAGTIGWWIFNEEGKLFLVSNNHVWANENKGEVGDLLIQPSTIDGGNEDDVFAELAGFIELKVEDKNAVDIAWARTVEPSYTSIIDFGGVLAKRDPILGEAVYIIGRSSGIASGKVMDTSALLEVDYDIGVLTFEDVAIYDGICRRGDSGAPVIGFDKSFLGLLFAGSDKVCVFAKTTNIENEITRATGKKTYVLVALSPPAVYVKPKQVEEAIVMPTQALAQITQQAILLTLLGLILRIILYMVLHTRSMVH